MGLYTNKRIPAAVVLICCFLFAGCKKQRTFEAAKPFTLDIETTIGNLAEVFLPGAVSVEGYGVIGNLRGTGSAECPPQIRDYLQKYILKQLPDIDASGFLSSADTAVVFLEGVIPAGTYKNQSFDLLVTALTGTQTTSLEGGWLYGAELKPAGRLGPSIRVLARAQGAVFMDTLSDEVSDPTTGYILSGGRVLDESQINVSLREPDYEVAGLIRNRINGRYGKDIAAAVSPGQIVVTVPSKYRKQKAKFASLVTSTYVAQTPQAIEARILQLVGKLAGAANKQQSEIALEAIGRQSLEKLSPLLSSSDEEVCLNAARCMLNLGSEKGLEALRRIATNENSLYRIEALEAINESAEKVVAAAISRTLLRDDDFDVKLAAYKSLKELDDITIMSDYVGRKLYLEQVTQTRYKGIYVTRSDRPTIVLFGGSLRCRENVFIQSPDGDITINARPSEPYVSIIRKHPRRPDTKPIQLKSTYEVGDIIRTLCEEPVRENQSGRPGLNVSYSEVIALLRQMCQKGAIEAEFRKGPPPKIGL
ncbi:flagellar basal body P-ring protein FlgI [Planctomycetota bacterium]